MTEPEIRKWHAHPRRHWCLACLAPVKRVVGIDREIRGTRVRVQCHGVEASRLIPDSFVEDYTRRTIRWFEEEETRP